MKQKKTIKPLKVLFKDIFPIFGPNLEQNLSGSGVLFRPFPYVTVRYETSLTLIQKSDNYGGPKNCIITDYIAPTTHLVKGPLSHLAT